MSGHENNGNRAAQGKRGSVNRPQGNDLAGKTIYGKYRIGDRLAASRSGVVYAAQKIADKQKVALVAIDSGKRVRPDLSSSAPHPNLIPIREVLQKGGMDTFVVIDPPQGKSLDAVLVKRGALDPSIATSTALQLLSALHSIHGQERVHGIIEPGNIFLDKGEDGKLLVTLIDVALIDEGGVPEDVRYLSPEQVIGEGTVDRTVDIWGVGVVLYEMLFGRVPFDGQHSDEISGKILFKEPDLKKGATDIPEELLSFLKRALEKESNDRYENVTAAAGDLLFVNEELEDTMAPAVAAALRESIAPPPPPPAALHASSASQVKPLPAEDKTATTKVAKSKEGLPVALKSFGAKEKKSATKKAPAKTPEPAPRPPTAGPDPQVDMAQQPEISAPPPLPHHIPETNGEPVTIPPEPHIEEPQDVTEQTAAPDTSEAQDEYQWRSGDVQERTTLPAPSGVFEELNQMAVTDESERVTAPAQYEELQRMADATIPSTTTGKSRSRRATLLAVTIAAMAVVGFLLVLLFALSKDDAEAVDPAASHPPSEPIKDESVPKRQPPKTQGKAQEPPLAEPAQPPADVPEDRPSQPDETQVEAAAGEPEASNQITITLIGVPEGALVKLNGKRVDHPIRVRKSNKKITLGVYQNGYHSHWERFAPREDREIQVDMPKRKGSGDKQAGEKGSWANNPWKN